jgi:hypothetical protein
MLREQAEERSSGAMMFKSGGAVLKRGYVWNETAIVATIYNFKVRIVIAMPGLPPAVSTRRWRTAGAVWASTREPGTGAFSLMLASSPESGHQSDRSACLQSADIVAKVFLGWRTKILRAADALYARQREGPYRFIQNRSRTSAVALKSDAAAEKSKDQLSRDFPGRSIFDFCNMG